MNLVRDEKEQEGKGKVEERKRRKWNDMGKDGKWSDGIGTGEIHMR